MQSDYLILAIFGLIALAYALATGYFLGSYLHDMNAPLFEGLLAIAALVVFNHFVIGGIMSVALLVLR